MRGVLGGGEGVFWEGEAESSRPQGTWQHLNPGQEGPWQHDARGQVCFCVREINPVLSFPLIPL